MSRHSIAFGLIGIAILSGCCCISLSRGEGYQKVGGQWSWVGIETGGIVPVTTPLSDDDAFTILEGDYAAKDSTRVYMRRLVIPGADPATFELLTNGYSKDASNVFLVTKPIPDADPETFEVIGAAVEGQNAQFAKDNSRVYYDGKELEGADPATFKPLEWQYSADATHVYLMDMRLDGSDPATFEMLKWGFAKDKRHAYLWGRRVETADGASFEFLGDGFCRDRNRVFVMRTVIDGADPKSFKRLGIRGPYARDATSIYCGIQRMVVEHPDRFEALPNSNLSEYGWARDGEFYYWGPERVEQADYASFQPIHNLAAADKNRRFEFQGQRGEAPWWPRN